MTILSKSASLESLELGPGTHTLKVVVAGDTMAFELAAPATSASPIARQGTGFVENWSGTARKIDDPGDEWLEHINRKLITSYP